MLPIDWLDPADHRDPRPAIEAMVCLAPADLAEPGAELVVGQGAEAGARVERAVPGHVPKGRQRHRREAGASRPFDKGLEERAADPAPSMARHDRDLFEM